MDILSIILKGGFLIYPILLASLVGLAITIDKFITLGRSRTNVSKFMLRLRNNLKKGDIDTAVAICMEYKTPAATIIRKGLKKYHLGSERVKDAIENAGKHEVARLEKGLPILATVAGVSPLLGFLGTVTGMIQAFMKIEDLRGTANPSDLAGGIWEALITTAFGLAVGIVALFFYNYFVAGVQKLVLDMETVSNEVTDVIIETEMESPKDSLPNAVHDNRSEV